jgi:alkylation response protein AidB-like acyl-CoA dehydrogenase
LAKSQLTIFPEQIRTHPCPEPPSGTPGAGSGTPRSSYGYFAEFIVERLYRDAPLMAIGEGTSDIQRLVIARSLVSGSGRLGWWPKIR